MLELQGKYNKCKIFTDIVDNETISQLLALLNQKSISESKIRIMSDCHAGAGCVIGTTMSLKDKVIPNLVGVDIGCGMAAYQLEETEIDLPLLDKIIGQYVPSGAEVHSTAIASSNVNKIIAPVNIDRSMLSLGTLGSGNHFIEVDRASDGSLWLVIHTGSRHLGIEICKYYQDLGYDKIKDNTFGSYNQRSKELIAKLKSEGKQKDISKQLEKLRREMANELIPIPHDLAYVSDDLFKNYIHDMKLTQEHADINRKTIAETIIYRMNLHVKDSFQTIHNYIDCDNMILRKGAVSAQKDERLIIPMNMRDGSLICVGKGNPDWNCSAPHGAGRLMSRSKAKEVVNLTDFKDSMKDIYSTSVNESTIDESPFAYKPMESIIKNIKDTVDIIDIVKPIYNFKASE